MKPLFFIIAVLFAGTLVANHGSGKEHKNIVKQGGANKALSKMDAINASLPPVTPEATPTPSSETPTPTPSPTPRSLP